MTSSDHERVRGQQQTPSGTAQADPAQAGPAGGEGAASGPAGDDLIVQDRWEEGHRAGEDGRMAGEDGRMAGDGGLGSDGGDAARVDAGLADTTTGTRQEGAGPGSEGAGPGGGLGPLAPEPPAPLPSEAPSSEVAFSDAPSSEAPFSEVPASQAAASGAPGSEAFTSGVPGSQAPGPQTAGPGGDAGGMERHEQLLTGAELDGIMVRWHEIQAGFVEEPRRAISEADALVTELIDRLTQMFAREREQLQAQCGAGNDVSTEDLRQGLRRYRTFFERLLAI